MQRTFCDKCKQEIEQGRTVYHWQRGEEKPLELCCQCDDLLTACLSEFTPEQESIECKVGGENFIARRNFLHKKLLDGPLEVTLAIMPLDTKLHKRDHIDSVHMHCPIPEYDVCVYIKKESLDNPPTS